VDATVFRSWHHGRLDIARAGERQECPMKSIKRLFSAAPEGTAVLFFIQIFATLGFAVLYSTLVLYATKHLQLSVKVATTLTGGASRGQSRFFTLDSRRSSQGRMHFEILPSRNSFQFPRLSNHRSIEL
jgi:hypothetical protein